MPKTDFENIQPLKRYRRQTDRASDRATDRHVIPIKGFHPLIIAMLLDYWNNSDVHSSSESICDQQFRQQHWMKLPLFPNTVKTLSRLRLVIMKHFSKFDLGDLIK
jgi:hypothetical protein